MDDLSAQLKQICDVWRSLLKHAQADKKVKFQNDADEAMAFFKADGNLWKNGDYLRSSFRDRTRDRETAGTVAPEFRTVVTKVAELQQLFGPTLYHQNPNRQVNPKQKVPVDPVFLGPEFSDPMMGPVLQQQIGLQRQMQAVQTQTVAQILESLLNWAVEENDLKGETRRCIDDALIKGLGLCVSELVTDPIGNKSIVTSYVDVDDFLQDPDATNPKDILWFAIKCVHSSWEVERTYNLTPGSLKDKATQESIEAQSHIDPDSQSERNRGKTSDLVTYYKIWSKCGFGDRLKNANKDLAGAFDQFGDYAYLVICPDVNYPLNLAPETLEVAAPEEVFLSAQWPIPFWMDRTHGWPFVPMAFHWVPGSIWPMSHIKPGLPYLKWLTWAMSFLMNNVASSCGNLIGVLKNLSEDTKKEFLEIGRNKLIEIESLNGNNINQIASVFKLASVDQGVLQAIQLVENYFEQATGLSELAYGMQSAASRSATDISVRSEAAGARVDDLAGTVEDFATFVARNEAIASRWLLTGQDVAPIVGPEAAMFWDQFISTTDPSDVVRSYSYSVESGSARRPNRNQKVEALNQALSSLLPVVTQFAGMGAIGPYNNLVSAWADAMNLDPAMLQIPAPVMPPPQQGQEGQQGQQKEPNQQPQGQ